MNNKTALLVIDMQNDFIDKNSRLAVKDIIENISKFNEFIFLCRKKGILIIYTQHIFDSLVNPIEARLFPDFNGLKENTRGADIHKSLIPLKDDIVIKKRRYDAFIGTILENLLRCRGIENIIITGTMTNICCESTARTAMMKDFNVFFCSDLTFTSAQDVHDNTLKNISTHFGKVRSSKQILSFF